MREHLNSMEVGDAAKWSNHDETSVNTRGFDVGRYPRRRDRCGDTLEPIKDTVRFLVKAPSFNHQGDFGGQVQVLLRAHAMTIVVRSGWIPILQKISSSPVQKAPGD